MPQSETRPWCPEAIGDEGRADESSTAFGTSNKGQGKLALSRPLVSPFGLVIRHSLNERLGNRPQAHNGVGQYGRRNNGR